MAWKPQVDVCFRQFLCHRRYWTADLKAAIFATITAFSKGPTYCLFWLVLALWLATAFPIVLWSVLTLELPLWPSFSEESTTEGIIIWAIFAAWF